MTTENEETGNYVVFRARSFDVGGAQDGHLPTKTVATDFDAAYIPPPDEEKGTFEKGGAERLGGEQAIDFASIKFQRENTLLTNAERYAASIRDEAELYVKQLRSEVEALNKQAELRYEEARLVKEAAEEEAKKRLEEADQKVEEVRRAAHGEGLEVGRQEGMEKRYAEAGRHLENLESILAELSGFRRQVDVFMEKDGIRLAVLIGKKIVGQELKINKKVVWRMLAATLAKMKELGTFRVLLNPEDFQFANAARPTLEKFISEEQFLKFQPDADLPPGNVLIKTDREVIDLTIASQFHHLESAIGQTMAERESEILSLPTPASIFGSPESVARAAESASAPQGATAPSAAPPANPPADSSAAPPADPPAAPSATPPAAPSAAPAAAQSAAPSAQSPGQPGESPPLQDEGAAAAPDGPTPVAAAEQAPAEEQEPIQPPRG